MPEYRNAGMIAGALRFAPRQITENVVLLTLRVPGTRLDTRTGERRRTQYFPSFTVFGREARRAMSLEEGQWVEIEYHLETRSKEVNGERRFFEDKIVDKLIPGPKLNDEVSRESEQGETNDRAEVDIGAEDSTVSPEKEGSSSESAPSAFARAFGR